MPWADATRAASTLPGPDVALGAAIVTAHHLRFQALHRRHQPHGFDTRAAAPIVWDYLTDPVKRPQWQKLVTEVIAQTEGRRGTGSVNHCMHGPDVIIEHVSDWRPFSYITLRYTVGDIEDWAWTIQLEPVDDATHVTMRLSNPGDEAWAVVREPFTTSVDDQVHHLEALLATATG